MARRALTFPELAGVVQQAGWPAEWQATAVAIAYAESSGQYWVVNSSGHEGLFQVAAEHHFPGNMLDPVQNAQAALKLRRARGTWGDWTTYTNGTYRLYLARAERAVGNPAAPPRSSPGSSGVAAAGFSDFAMGASGFTGFFTLISDPGAWMRGGWTLLGGILIAWALYMMMGRSASRDVTSIAKVAVTRKPVKAVK